MAQVAVQVNGRSYDIACDDGQEAHVDRLAGYLDQKVCDLASQIGQVGDTRLLVMASLLIIDELSEAYGALEEAAHRPASAGSSAGSLDEGRLADGLDKLAGRIDQVANRLERP